MSRRVSYSREQTQRALDRQRKLITIDVFDPASGERHQAQFAVTTRTSHILTRALNRIVDALRRGG